MVEMVRMKAIGDTASVSIGENSYSVVDGFISVPADAVDDVSSHGFVVSVGDEEDPNFVPSEDIGTMNRLELFAFLKAKGVSVKPPISNDELRRLAKEANGEPVEPAPASPVEPPVTEPAAENPAQTPVSEPEAVPAAEQPATAETAPTAEPVAEEMASTEPVATDINEHTV